MEQAEYSMCEVTVWQTQLPPQLSFVQFRKYNFAIYNSQACPHSMPRRSIFVKYDLNMHWKMTWASSCACGALNHFPHRVYEVAVHIHPFPSTQRIVPPPVYSSSCVEECMLLSATVDT